MLSIFHSSPKKIQYYFPDGIEDVEELIKRSFEVIKPSIPRNWNNLVITYSEKKLKIVLDNSEVINPNYYSRGYIFKFIKELVNKSKNKPRIVVMKFKNLTKEFPLSYDLFFGD